MRARAWATAAAALLAGCATYSPRPLPANAGLAPSAGAVAVDHARLPFADLATHRYDPSDGFDIDELAMLAVANNPDLRAARSALDVARAQSFQAGLLPDPQLALTADFPTNGTSGNTSALGINPTYDIGALLASSSRKAAATIAERRVNRELLWKEWQVVGRARLLYVRIVFRERLAATLGASREVLAAQLARSRAALAAGDLTLDRSAADAVALQALERRIDDLARKRAADRAALDALLGLEPGAPVRLAGIPPAAAIDGAAVMRDLDTRLAGRPDIAALRAGYRSQEAKFRAAVLGQFPSLNVGLTHARDTSGLYSLGFGLTMSLPIFDGNRGNVAIERATREKLREEYRARLASARSESATAFDNLRLLDAQIAGGRAALSDLATIASQAKTAYRQGDLAAAQYVQLQSARLEQEARNIELEEARMEQRIALESLLGPLGPAAARGERP